MASAILEKEPEPLSVLKPTSPVALDRAIRKCLGKDPDARWQSASDLGSELQWIAESGWRSQSAARPAGEKKYSSRTGWIMAAGLLLALAGVSAAWWTGPQRAQQTMHFSIPFQGIANDVALSPDGQTVAMVSYWEQGNNFVIWIYKIGERRASVLSGTEDASHPFWSPDGKWIGFFAQGKLKKVDISGRSAQVLADAPNGRGGAWNKEGMILFTPDVFQGLHLESSAGGVVKGITKLDPSGKEASHRWPVFLPDGRHYLYLTANFSGQFEQNAIYLGSLDSTGSQLIVHASLNAAYAEPGYLLYLRERDKALVAQKFNAKTYTLSGEPRAVQGEVQYLAQIDPGHVRRGGATDAGRTDGERRGHLANDVV